jgi:hypothetical protein
VSLVRRGAKGGAIYGLRRVGQWMPTPKFELGAPGAPERNTMIVGHGP